MEKLYPQVSDMCYICNEENLCPIRKTDGKWMVRFIDWNWWDTEIELKSVLNKKEFKGKKINKLYSSGFVFLKEWESDSIEVFLLTTDKKWKQQHQFTWWAPINERHEHIFSNNDEWDLIINMELVLSNAQKQLYERTQITNVEIYGEIPTADWVLKPSNDWWSWDLIFLIHFLAASNFTGELKYNKENSMKVVDWNWYNISDLDSLKWVAPNISAVTEEMIHRHYKNQ